ADRAVGRRVPPHRSPLHCGEGDQFASFGCLGSGEVGVRIMSITKKANSWLGPTNLAFVEGMYEEYLRKPDSVPPDWQQYFAEIGDGEHQFPKVRFGPSFRPLGLFEPPARSPTAREPLCVPETAALQDRIYLLIRLFRV